jgi:U1 small nuclear ribonucleoprotein C
LQPSVRKTHCAGRKHKDNVKFFYQKWMEDQAQSLIDATSKYFSIQKEFICVCLLIIIILAAAFKAGKIPANPFGGPGVPGKGGVSIPPPGMSGMPPGMMPRKKKKFY